MFDKESYTLYKFHKQLNQSFQNKRELLECALPALRNLFKLDRVYFFDWQQERALLSLKMMCKQEYCMDMQEDISVINEPMFLKTLLREGFVISTDLSYPAAYVLVRWQRPAVSISGESFKTYMEERVGVIRMERFRKNRVFTSQEEKLIKALAEEISHNLRNTEIDQAKNQRLAVSTALNQLATIFASSLRLNDGLELILKGVQKYFRFDRVRLYLTNYDGTKIKSILGADISGQVTVQDETALKEGEKELLREVFDSPNTYTSRRSVIYIPLKVQRNKVGFLTFDNLLSRRKIGYLDFISLKQFSTQIALSIDNAMLFERVQELSNYDELTKLPVRRFFNEKFAEELYRSKRFDLIMSLIILDIDLFKQINDGYGHQIGDWALKEVARVIRTSLRQTDFPCRFGGDEMIIMLPRTNGEEAKIIAKRLQERIRAITIPSRYTEGKEVHLSISQGISVFPMDGKDESSLLEKADKALYAVKQAGRGSFALYRDVAGAEE
ncbi:sensor domain-containing diguanylate cyclase [Candidatus Avelusimicrobium aviculae]|uniref:sensor domain-containing diguanylate cyclase n=1 Tax=Candidatus Avelusimicrobium aviculae TaxID=3416206 RepID=UPI003D101035